MCQKETCLFYNFCNKCQKTVDLVHAKAERDACIKSLGLAEENVVKCQKHVNEEKTKSDLLNKVNKPK